MEKKITAVSTFILLILALSGCASKETAACPTTGEEAVSVCRAKQKCLNLSTSTGIGVGFGLSPGNSPGSGSGTSQRETNHEYPDCVDRDLATQKKLADPAIKK